MKKKTLIVLLSLILLIIFTAIALYFFLPDDTWKHPIKIEKANRIIKQIEQYKIEKGYFPKTIDELNIENSLKDIFYYKNNGEYFFLFFGGTLGESLLYDSRDKTWR